MLINSSEDKIIVFKVFTAIKLMIKFSISIGIEVKNQKVNINAAFRSILHHFFIINFKN